MSEISDDAAEHVYMQLARILRAQIAAGEIPPGRFLPSKKQLKARYGVAGGTVDRAMRVLRDEGLIDTLKGRGLYVLPPSRAA